MPGTPPASPTAKNTSAAAESARLSATARPASDQHGPTVVAESINPSPRPSAAAEAPPAAMLGSDFEADIQLAFPNS